MGESTGIGEVSGKMLDFLCKVFFHNFLFRFCQTALLNTWFVFLIEADATLNTIPRDALLLFVGGLFVRR